MEENKKIELLKIWNTTYLFQTIPIMFILLVLTCITDNVIIGILAWIITFTFMDTALWGQLINNQAHWNEQKYIIPYRISQLSFQAILSISIMDMTIFKTIVIANLLWWFGICDGLYYFIGKYRVDDPLEWMDNWSVQALIPGVCNKRMFFIVIGIGILLSIGVYIIWK